MNDRRSSGQGSTACGPFEIRWTEHGPPDGEPVLLLPGGDDAERWRAAGAPVRTSTWGLPHVEAPAEVLALLDGPAGSGRGERASRRDPAPVDQDEEVRGPQR